MEHLDNLAIFILASFAGAIANWLRMWTRKLIAGSLTAYLFHDHPRETLYAGLVLVGSGCTAYLTGNLDSVEVRALIYTSFMTGFVVDNTINKGSPKS